MKREERYRGEKEGEEREGEKRERGRRDSSKSETEQVSACLPLKREKGNELSSHSLPDKGNMLSLSFPYQSRQEKT